MIIDHALRAGTSQPGIPVDMGPENEAVRKATLHKRQILNAPLKADEIARRVGLSATARRAFRAVVSKSVYRQDPADNNRT